MSGSASTERMAGLAATLAAKEGFSETALTTPIFERSNLTVPPAAVTAATAAEVSLPLLTTRYWVGAATAEPANAATRNAIIRFMDGCSFVRGPGVIAAALPMCRRGRSFSWAPQVLQGPSDLTQDGGSGGGGPPPPGAPGRPLARRQPPSLTARLGLAPRRFLRTFPA